MKAAFAREVGMLGVNLFDIHGDIDEWDLTDSIRKSLGLVWFHYLSSYSTKKFTRSTQPVAKLELADLRNTRTRGGNPCGTWNFHMPTEFYKMELNNPG